MRYSGNWVVLANDPIFEFIRNDDSGTPEKYQDSGYVRYSRQYISTRRRKMAEHGLLNDLGNGVSTLTDRGEASLEGEIDTSEDAPDETPDGPSGADESGIDEEA